MEKQLLGCVYDKTQNSNLDRAKERERERTICLSEGGNIDDDETTVSFVECTGPGTISSDYVHSFFLTSQLIPEVSSIADLIL